MGRLFGCLGPGESSYSGHEIFAALGVRPSLIQEQVFAYATGGLSIVGKKRITSVRSPSSVKRQG